MVSDKMHLVVTLTTVHNKLNLTKNGGLNLVLRNLHRYVRQGQKHSFQDYLGF